MTTTTTNGPRLTDLLRLLLYRAPGHTTREYRDALCDAGLCHDSSKISAILYTLRRRGEVERIEDAWYLTERGEQKARQYLYFYENLPRLKKAVVETVKILAELAPGSIQGNNNCQTKDAYYTPPSRLTKTNTHKHRLTVTNRRLTGGKTLLEELDEDEREILDMLIERFEKWGSTWIPIEELVERGYDHRHLARVLRRLASKRLVYWYQRQGRVGLGRAAKQLLGLASGGGDGARYA